MTAQTPVPTENWSALEFYQSGTSALIKGDWGLAVAHLEKARRLEPLDGDVHAQLKIARLQLARETGRTDAMTGRESLSLQTWMGHPDVAPHLLGGLGVLSLLWSIRLLHLLLKRAPRRALVLTTLWGVVPLLGWMTMNQFIRTPTAVALRESNLRSGPGNNYSPIGSLRTGEVVTLEAPTSSNAPDWQLISRSSSNSAPKLGWIEKDALLPFNSESNRQKAHP